DLDLMLKSLQVMNGLFPMTLVQEFQRNIQAGIEGANAFVGGVDGRNQRLNSVGCGDDFDGNVGGGHQSAVADDQRNGMSADGQYYNCSEAACAGSGGAVSVPNVLQRVSIRIGAARGVQSDFGTTAVPGNEQGRSGAGIGNGWSVANLLVFNRA